MGELDVVRACGEALVNKQSVTAVFVGRTSGIGEYSLRALAALHGLCGHGLRVYRVGRTLTAANKIIADCKRACPVGDFNFIRANDLASLREVDRVCKEIIRAEEARVGKRASIYLLVMSQAYFAFGSKLERQVTKEGLDLSFSLFYYSRMRFVTQVLPLLTASPLPGRDTKLILDDLSHSKPQNFNFTTLGSHAASHYFPMLVMTPVFNGEVFLAGLKGVYTVLNPLFKVLSVNPRECGDRLLFRTSPRFPARPTNGETHPAKAGDITIAMSTDGSRGGGVSRVNWNGEEVPLRKGYNNLRKDEVRKKVWGHTMAAFQGISDDGHFFG